MKNKEKSKQKFIPTSAGEGPFTVSYIRGIVNRYDYFLIFLILVLAYNTTSYNAIISGDVLPASILPFSLIVYHSPNFDYFADFLTHPSFQYAFPAIGEHTYSLFPIVTPVLITPLYFIWFSLYSVFGIPLTLADIFMWAKIAASILAALSCVFFYLSVKELFQRKIALVTTLVFAFATSTWSVSSQALWQHGMVELLLILMIYIIVRNEKNESIYNIIFLGLLSGLFIFNRPPDSLLLIPVVAYILFYYRKSTPWYVGSAVLSGLPFLFYNMTIFGNFFGGYRENISFFTFDGSLFTNFAGLLVSPNVGLLVFSPVLLLSIIGYLNLKKIQMQRMERILFIYGPVILLQILLYSLFGLWFSSTGYSYGQRFLTGLIPILMIYVGIVLNEYLLPPKKSGKSSLAQIALIILILISVVIQGTGVFFYAYNPDQSMSKEKVWDVQHNIVASTYLAGKDRIEYVTMYTFPPLPPVFRYSFRPSPAV